MSMLDLLHVVCDVIAALYPFVALAVAFLTLWDRWRSSAE